jgi:thioesterase-3
MKSRIEIRIRGYHSDRFAHVNHARYLEFMEEGRWTYLEDNNLLDLFLKEGIHHVVVNININYKKPALVGDVICIETGVMKRGDRTVTMLQEVFSKDSGAPVADAKVTNVFMDSNDGNILKIDKRFLDLWPDLREIL